MQVDLKTTWERLTAALDEVSDGWRAEVQRLSVHDQLSRRDRGDTFSDCQVFEAMLLALLSSNVAWSTVERVRSRLQDLVCQFDWHQLADLNDDDVAKIYEAFKLERAGGQNLRRMLGYFRDTAGKLRKHVKPPGAPVIVDGGEAGGLDAYFGRLFQETGKDPDLLAVKLGSPGELKLRGFGVPLAAEALRNLGYDLAKPDRHILRAVGMWGLVEFRNWTDRSNNRAPVASPDELLNAMGQVHKLAAAAGKSTSETDTTIWFACAKQGAGFSNARLAAIGSP